MRNKIFCPGHFPPLAAGCSLAVVLLTGCGSSGTKVPGAGVARVGAAHPGGVRVLLADAPVAGLQAVNVTFTKLEALYDGEGDSQAIEDKTGNKSEAEKDVAQNDGPHNDGSHNGATQTQQADQNSEDDNDQWVTLSDKPAGPVNLLDFANKPVQNLFTLLNVNVPSGHYKQFRFTVGTVTVVDDKGSHPATLVNNTIVVKGGWFVDPTGSKTLLVDFDVMASLTGDSTSGYVFDPKLRLLPEELSGAVAGTVQFQSAAPVNQFEAQVELLDAAGQTVAESEIQVKTDTPTTAATGKYVMNAVPLGIYTLRVVGQDTFDGASKDASPVTVVAGGTAQADVALTH